MPEGFFGHFLNEDYYEVAAVEAAGYYKFANRDQNEASLRCPQEAELIIAASGTEPLATRAAIRLKQRGCNRDKGLVQQEKYVHATLDASLVLLPPFCST